MAEWQPRRQRCRLTRSRRSDARMQPDMLQLDRIIGDANDRELADRLHALEHLGRVEYILLGGDDIHRHRLHARTDRGTECAITLPRSQRLANGAILLLETERAIVVRLKEQRFLALAPRDAGAALELGYFAGNMHWPVRFAGPVLRIALDRPEREYLDRLAPFLNDGRIRQLDDAQ